jgi:hypothetical protein
MGDMIASLFLLLHLLMFVYWLGGDLGAFYAASLVTDRSLSADARLTAAKILNEVDMAPSTCLILALPTGALLASSRGWWPLGMGAAWLILVASLVWLALVWRQHRLHGSDRWLRRIDLSIRWVLLLLLPAVGLAALTGVLPLPLFIALKLLILAGTIALGLAVRGVLGPYIIAYGELKKNGGSPAVDEGLHWSLSRAKPMVLAIWALLVAAAILGITHVA